MLRIATWNVNSLKVRLPHLIDWVNEHKPDVFALQETKTTDPTFPKEEIEALGYHVVYTGQKTFNGVAILSRTPIDDPVLALPGFDDPQKRLLAATVRGVRIIDVYVPNGSEVGSEKYDYKLAWLKHFTRFLKKQLVSYENVVVLGDFNIAPADLDVHDPSRWHGAVLVSEPERAAFEKLLDLGLYDAFREHNKVPGFSWWDYRGDAFNRNHGMRIDHILYSDGLKPSFSACFVDDSPRKLERPSDHTPVIVDFDR